MIRILNFLAGLRNQMWLIPALMTLAAVSLLHFVLTHRLGAPDEIGEFWWLFGGDADRARDLIATLLGGLITMTSLVVSVTFVTLSLAANQLGPRLIWNFIGDRQIQTVIGVFVSTIVYLLLLLRSLDGTDVPYLAVTFGNVLTLGCLVALLFYVHKVSHAIVADTVVEQVSRELGRAITALPADEIRSGVADIEAALEAAPSVSKTYSLGRQGYIQTMDYEALAKLAADEGGMLRLFVRPGDFVLASGNHAEYRGAAAPEKPFEKALHGTVEIGAFRSPAQDIEFTMCQLTEIALRALSSGLNDMYTALAVIDRLTAAFEIIIGRGMNTVLRRDENGVARLIVQRYDPGSLVKTAYDEIRRNGGRQAAVLIHLADSMKKLAVPARAAHNEELLDALQAFLVRVEQTAEAGLPAECDRIWTRERIAAARESLQGDG